MALLPDDFPIGPEVPDPLPPNADTTMYTIALVVAVLLLMAFVVCVGNQSIGLNIPPSAPTALP
jgi:hypothetical protein